MVSAIIPHYVNIEDLLFAGYLTSLQDGWDGRAPPFGEEGDKFAVRGPGRGPGRAAIKNAMSVMLVAR